MRVSRNRHLENASIDKKQIEKEKSNIDEDSIKLETEKEIPYRKEDISLGKLSKGRLVKVVLAGLTSSILLGGIVYGVYYNQIMYPEEMVRDVESSGLGAIISWQEALRDYKGDSIKNITGEESYLSKEVLYANGSKNKIDFLDKVISTVSYHPKKVQALNKYGNTMVDRNNDIVYTDSLVNGVNEEVDLKYIDYSKLVFDADLVRSKMKSLNVKVGDVDYSNKLEEVFCRYIADLDIEDIPLKTETVVPNLSKSSSGYYMLSDEDIYLDRVLFSSNDFYDALYRFSEVADSSEDISDEWLKWDSLSKKDKSTTVEPNKYKTNLVPTDEWVKWNTDENKDNIKEPTKYVGKSVINKNWCGSFYLLNEYVGSNGDREKVDAELGDGSFKNPASLGTSVLTSIFVVDEKGNRVAKPIKVKLVDFKVSQDAIDYFEGKDERNRGYDVKSEVQYACYTFEVTNLSNDTLVIYDDSSLSDKSANMSPRTGTIYGIQDSVTLKPDETGKIESWGNSTELNTKYLVWGKDFSREAPVVWFRVLSGDLEDTSKNKGVSINDSRYSKDDE